MDTTGRAGKQITPRVTFFKKLEIIQKPALLDTFFSTYLLWKKVSDDIYLIKKPFITKTDLRMITESRI